MKRKKKIFIFLKIRMKSSSVEMNTTSLDLLFLQFKALQVLKLQKILNS